MKLQNIIENSGEFGSLEIDSLAFSSEEIGENCLFFCLKGINHDGHDFAKIAVEKGAVAVVAQREIAGLTVPQIIVENSRRELALAASAFFHAPSKRLKMIAVTGTNGKTTTTYVVKSILESAGKNVGIIGTNKIMIGKDSYSSCLTTPDPIELHQTLKRMLDSGIEYVVMEASAHALALNKLDGIVFEVAAFTNLSRDHLDFFENLENYFLAKSLLFTKEKCKFAIINVDDDYGRRLAKSLAIPSASFGCYNPSDVFAIEVESSINGVRYVLNASDDIAEICFCMPGRFNVYNSLCGAAIAKALNISIKEIALGIKSQKRVDGRYNVIKTARGSIVIDFAHTDDGLKNVLLCSQEFCRGNIITVFGCGGNRDKTKRPLMGQVAVSLSDFVIITSDNPRKENPNDIILDIVKGITAIGKTNYGIEPDRFKAIARGIERMGKGDILIIAGKGAEDYQEINGVKYPFKDEEAARKICANNGLINF